MVTAIICAYNEEKMLPGALHSLFAQTRVPDEVLVVNNASTDRTREIAKAFPGVTVVDDGTMAQRRGSLSIDD